MKLRFVYIILLGVSLLMGLSTHGNVSNESYKTWYNRLRTAHDKDNLEDESFFIILLEGAFNYDQKDSNHLAAVAQDMRLHGSLSQIHIDLWKLQLQEGFEEATRKLEELSRKCVADWKIVSELDMAIHQERTAPEREFTFNTRVVILAKKGLQALTSLEKFYNNNYKKNIWLLSTIGEESKLVELHIPSNDNPELTNERWKKTLESYKNRFNTYKKEAEATIQKDLAKEERLALEPEDAKEFQAKWINHLENTKYSANSLLEYLDLLSTFKYPSDAPTANESIDHYRKRCLQDLSALNQFYQDHQEDYSLLKSLALGAKKTFKSKKLESNTPNADIAKAWQMVLEDFKNTCKEASDEE